MINCDWWNIKWNTKNGIDDLYLGVYRRWSIDVCINQKLIMLWTLRFFWHVSYIIVEMLLVFCFLDDWVLPTESENGKLEPIVFFFLTYSLYLIAYSNMHLINWWHMVSSQLCRLVELILLAFCAWSTNWILWPLARVRWL